MTPRTYGKRALHMTPRTYGKSLRQHAYIMEALRAAALHGVHCAHEAAFYAHMYSHLKPRRFYGVIRVPNWRAAK